MASTNTVFLSLVAVVVALLGIILLYSTKHQMSNGKQIYALRRVTPLEYKVTLRIDCDYRKDNFTGEVEIELRIETPMKFDEITLEGIGIKVHEAYLTVLDSPPMTTKLLTENRPSLVEKAETILFQANRVIELHTMRRIKLKLKYTANFAYPGVGMMYDMVYMMAQPNHVGAVFPCFQCVTKMDIKSSFQLTILHPRDTVAVSNMNTDGPQEMRSDPYLKTRFHKTLGILPYVLSFVVARDLRNFSMYGWPDSTIYFLPDVREAEAREIYSTANEIRQRFQRDWKIRDRGDKFDMVLVPDLPINGSESWGLILLRYVPGKQLPEHFIRHEVIHIWAGNSVSVNDFKYIWLQEGIASMYEFGLEFNTPNLITFFRNPYFTQMSPATEEPLTYAPDPPTLEYMKMFSIPIKFWKAALVLDMFRQFVGKRIFDKTLAQYLKEYELQYFDERTLFQLKMKLPLPDVRTWTLHKHVPVIHITFEPSENRYRLTQKVFKGSVKRGEDVSQRWSIPLHYTFLTQADEMGKTEKMWMNDETVYIPVPQNHHTIMLSPLSAPPYIIYYEDDTCQKFTSMDPTTKQYLHMYGVHICQQDSARMRGLKKR